VQTDRGSVECERVLLCAGIWGPTVGALAGVPIPLVAVQHQLVWTDPIPELAGMDGDTWARQPVVRHQDMSLYFRGAWTLTSGTTEDRSSPQRVIVDRPRVHNIDAVHPDDSELCHGGAKIFPCRQNCLSDQPHPSWHFVHPTPARRRRDAAVRASGSQGGKTPPAACSPGLMMSRFPNYDLAGADNRPPFQTSAPYVLERGKQQYREVYDIIHPLQQPSKPRGLKLTPFFERHRALGAEFFQGAGWERPQWFAANRELVGGVTHEWARRTGWAARGWSAEVGAEHPATREGGPVRYHAREVDDRAGCARLPRAGVREPSTARWGLRPPPLTRGAASGST
jgi:hypothetical protein